MDLKVINKSYKYSFWFEVSRCWWGGGGHSQMIAMNTFLMCHEGSLIFLYLSYQHRLERVQGNIYVFISDI